MFSPVRNAHVLLYIIQPLQTIPGRDTGLGVQTQRRVYWLVLLQRGRRRVRHAKLRERAHGYRGRVRHLVRLRGQAQHAGALAGT